MVLSQDEWNHGFEWSIVIKLELIDETQHQREYPVAQLKMKVITSGELKYTSSFNLIVSVSHYMTYGTIYICYTCHASIYNKLKGDSNKNSPSKLFDDRE